MIFRGIQGDDIPLNTPNSVERSIFRGIRRSSLYLDYLSRNKLGTPIAVASCKRVGQGIEIHISFDSACRQIENIIAFCCTQNDSIVIICRQIVGKINQDLTTRASNPTARHMKTDIRCVNVRQLCHGVRVSYWLQKPDSNTVDQL